MSKCSMSTEETCPKHGTQLRLRRNVLTGEVALACPLCDIENRGGTDADIRAVAEKLTDPPTDE
jgi:hypothetical protein